MLTFINIYLTMGGKPINVFKYPGDRRMCADGKIRAATYGQQIIKGETSAEEVEKMAQKGEWALNRGASTHKKNLIAHIVYYLFKIGKLEEYVNEEGDFLREDGTVTNIEKYSRIADRFRKK